MKINSSCGDVSVEMKNGSAEKTNIYLKTADGDVDTEGLSRGKTDNEEDTSVYENKAGASAPTLNVECSDGDITLTESENKEYEYPSDYASACKILKKNK